MSTLIEQILVEQNSHWSATPYQHSLVRIHDKQAITDAALDEIQIITGIRRCGKSTLLQTLINHLMKGINTKAILYLNLDDPNFIPAYNDPSSLYTIIEAAEKLTQTTVQFLFLDEIQNISAWEKYVKSSYDSKRFKKMFISGSNSDLLNSNYASLLSGRYIETKLFPLTYKEVLLNNGIRSPLEMMKHKIKALTLLDNMLTMGSFPRIQLIDSHKQKRKVLKSYFETIVLKDCIQNHNIRDTRSLISLAHYLIGNTTRLYSYNSLKRAIGSNENTIHNFIQILQDSYLLHEIKQFTQSLKTPQTSKKKPYCVDNGLITATTIDISSDYGKLLENLVYTEFRKQSNTEITFHNESNECDFIVQTCDGLTAIQVCHQITAENRGRELNGLHAAMKKFSIDHGIVVTYNQSEKVSNNINIIPFWKYFSTE